MRNSFPRIDCRECPQGAGRERVDALQIGPEPGNFLDKRSVDRRTRLSLPACADRGFARVQKLPGSEPVDSEKECNASEKSSTEHFEC